MATTASVTLTTVKGDAATLRVGGGPLLIDANCLDANGAPSGAKVFLTSSDRAVAKLTTDTQLGNAPAGVVGIGAGSATITATAEDNSGAVATLAVTVS